MGENKKRAWSMRLAAGAHVLVEDVAYADHYCAGNSDWRGESIFEMIDTIVDDADAWFTARYGSSLDERNDPERWLGDPMWSVEVPDEMRA